MSLSGIGDLVFCPGCGNVQNEGEVCTKCGFFITKEQKEEKAIEIQAHRKDKKTKVSLQARRKTSKLRMSSKEPLSKTPKRTHQRKTKATS